MSTTRRKDRVRQITHRTKKSETVLKICMAICEVMAIVGCLIYYIKYHYGEYKPIDVVYLAVILGLVGGGLAICLSKLICKVFHIEDDN